eukprot:6313977-Prorocentrum_lima.AAC.1
MEDRRNPGEVEGGLEKVPEPRGAVPQLAEARQAPFGDEGKEGREGRKPEDLLVRQVGVSKGGPG